MPSDGHTLVFRSVTSQESVKATYHRLSLGERTNCASSVTGWVAKVAPPSKASRKSKSAAGPSQPTRSMSQSRRNAVSPETATLQSESNSPLAPSDGAVKWYDLRPNRCKSFHESQPGYVIDRHRFPHFFNSYKDWLQLRGTLTKTTLLYLGRPLRIYLTAGLLSFRACLALHQARKILVRKSTQSHYDGHHEIRAARPERVLYRHPQSLIMPSTGLGETRRSMNSPEYLLLLTMEQLHRTMRKKHGDGLAAKDSTLQ